jgi:hypothetical protein
VEGTQVKWAAPSESGGLPLEYVVEMTPPPGKGDANLALPSTSDVSLCCFKRFCGSLG